MTRIDEIRDRLDNATQWLNLTHGGNVTYVYMTLIANAPADLAWLLDAVARRDARCEDLAVQLDAIRAVLGEEPDPCPEHPDDDPITCGWKRDNLTIRHILSDTKEN